MPNSNRIAAATPTVTMQDAIARYRASAGTATFAKRGRNPLFPYVPVIHHAHDTRASVSGRTEQVRGFAYVTPAEAEAKAQEVIDGRVRWFAGQLCKRPCRALREQWGLPRELEISADDARLALGNVAAITHD